MLIALSRTSQTSADNPTWPLTSVSLWSFNQGDEPPLGDRLDVVWQLDEDQGLHLLRHTAGTADLRPWVLGQDLSLCLDRAFITHRRHHVPVERQCEEDKEFYCICFTLCNPHIYKGRSTSKRHKKEGFDTHHLRLFWNGFCSLETDKISIPATLFGLNII